MSMLGSILVLCNYNNIIVMCYFLSSTTPHNKAIKAKILDEICKRPNNTYPDGSIRGILPIQCVDICMSKISSFIAAIVI